MPTRCRDRRPTVVSATSWISFSSRDRGLKLSFSGPLLRKHLAGAARTHGQRNCRRQPRPGPCRLKLLLDSAAWEKASTPPFLKSQSSLQESDVPRSVGSVICSVRFQIQVFLSGQSRAGRAGNKRLTCLPVASRTVQATAGSSSQVETLVVEVTAWLVPETPAISGPSGGAARQGVCEKQNGSRRANDETRLPALEPALVDLSENCHHFSDRGTDILATCCTNWPNP